MTPPPPRVAVLHCPDWPAVALGVGADDPAVVVAADRVVAATPAARADGVGEGMRRRTAQARSPALTVLERDRDLEARRFEAVVVAVTTCVPTVELAVPGTCRFLAGAASRHAGGDTALVATAGGRVDEVLARLAGGWRCGVGIADGVVAAELAARAGGGVVPAGGSAAFLAPFPLGVLARPWSRGMPVTGAGVADRREVLDVLGRLGVDTLGGFAALDAASVLARFGVVGVALHRLAQGDDPVAPRTVEPPGDRTVTVAFDDPVDRLDRAAFVAKTLADRLVATLDDAGLVCRRLVVEAVTEDGDVLVRPWVHPVAFTAGAIAERVRWQLEGWVAGPASDRPGAGLVSLSLAPDLVVPATGRQEGLWGGTGGDTETVARTLARVAGLLGPDAVRLPERRGGRHPGESHVLVPATTVDLAARLTPRRRPRGRRGAVDPPDRATAPWPGRLPTAPARVASAGVSCTVVDATGAPVTVDGRGAVGAPPAQVDGRSVVAWGGPWPVEERWWDRRTRRRVARLQVVLDDDRALLVELEDGRWRLAAVHD